MMRAAIRAIEQNFTKYTGAGGTLKLDATQIGLTVPAGACDNAYQVRVFATGTRTNPLFSGQVTFDNFKDVLIVTVPDVAAPGGISALLKVEGGGPIATIPTL
jgi:F420-dependent methylenetetrahydromethanopterin dehydrogenase